MKGYIFNVTIILFYFYVISYARQYTVIAGDEENPYVFEPAMLEIEVGDTVTWTSNLDTHRIEQVTTPSDCFPMEGGFDSDLLNNGESFSFTFDEEGTFFYMCSVDSHCSLGMKGSIMVGSEAGESDMENEYGEDGSEENNDEGYPSPDEPPSDVPSPDDPSSPDVPSPDGSDEYYYENTGGEEDPYYPPDLEESEDEEEEDPAEEDNTPPTNNSGNSLTNAFFNYLETFV